MLELEEEAPAATRVAGPSAVVLRRRGAEGGPAVTHVAGLSEAEVRAGLSGEGGRMA